MLKYTLIFCLLIMTVNYSYAKENTRLIVRLYNVANLTEQVNPVKAKEMKNTIETFLIEANMLNFDESKANWANLNNGWLYDKNSVQHLYLRHLGVYKSQNGKIMGTFDVTCTDINDIQERHFGYVSTTEVYLSTNINKKRGHSKGLFATFCK